METTNKLWMRKLTQWHTKFFKCFISHQNVPNHVYNLWPIFKFCHFPPQVFQNLLLSCILCDVQCTFRDKITSSFVQGLIYFAIFYDLRQKKGWSPIEGSPSINSMHFLATTSVLSKAWLLLFLPSKIKTKVYFWPNPAKYVCYYHPALVWRNLNVN